MELLAAALLGVVQGLTEFLPVSSSAHLILARAWFGWDAEAFGLAFDVACHVGTLLAIVLYFRADLAAMARSATGLVAGRPDGPARELWLIAVGTVPVVVAGLLGQDVIEARLRTPAVTVVTLSAGALLMLVAERVGRRSRDAGSLGVGEALILGLAQAAALVPGVSRSGATITVALLLGLQRQAGARFSFLLGMPAMVAAAGLEGWRLVGTSMDAGMAATFATGLVVSAVVGYATIKYFMRFLGGHRLDVFAVYRLALALAVVVFLLR